MDEEKEKNFSVDTEQLKNETKDTVNQVKEQIKNTDFKKDAEDTKGFVKEMFVNPFEAIRKVATGEENILSKVVIIMIIFIAASVIHSIISLMKYGKYSGLGSNLLSLVASVLGPVFYIAVPAIIVLILNRTNKKSLITVISTLVVTSIPVAINEVISIISVLVSGASIITSPVTSMFTFVATVLTYFGMKDIFEEEDGAKFIKTFAIIELLSSFAIVILARIGIY